MRTLLFAIAAVVVVTLTGASLAQSRGAGHLTGAPPTFTPGFAVLPAPSISPGVQPPAFRNGTVFFYSDLGYAPIAPQPVSVVVVQPPPAPPQPEEQPPAARPLLLELEGDQWVQVDHFRNTSPATDAGRSRKPALKPLPTILVFRDHREEVTSAYAIVGDALYAQTDYWITGAWTKKIALADLDLPATIETNQQRGVAFKLPGGSNEVVLQP